MAEPGFDVPGVKPRFKNVSNPWFRKRQSFRITLGVPAKADPRLKWVADGGVRVVAGQIRLGRAQQTITARRKRSRERLTDVLHSQGWRLSRSYDFHRR
jgi:hypothetical protein